MTCFITKGMLFGAAALIAPTAGAQTFTKLLMESDVISFGAGTETVSAVFNVDINDGGSWLAEFDTTAGDTAMDNGIMLNGTVIHREGTSEGFPASHAAGWVYDSFVDSMDINDNGDRLLMFNVEDTTGTVSDKKLILWTSGASGMTFPILEEEVTLCTIAGEPAGAVWDSISEVWQNNNNELLVAGRSNTDADDFLVHMTHDGAGTILTQTAFAMDNVNHAVAFPPSNGVHATNVQGFTTSKRNIALNNAGQKMFYIDDDHTVSGGDTNLDSHYYIDTTEIAWEGDDAPTAGTFPYNHLSSAEVDLNDGGDWVAAWDDDNPDSGFDGFILKNGVLFAQEGDLAPDLAGGFVLEGNHFENGGVQISDSGDVTWTAEWNDPDTSKDNGLYRNYDLILQEGVTMIDGQLVQSCSTSQGGDDMAVSDNGSYIIKVLELAGGLEGAFLIDMNPIESYCFGDGAGSACPCGNIGAAGEGCQNSSGTGGILTATGTQGLAADNLGLSGSQLPAMRPALFFVGTNQTNMGNGNLFGDGLLCVGGPIIRLEVVFSDAAGECSTSNPIGSTIGATAGQDSFFQLWFRDPGGVCGSGFNTTNAISLTWF